MLLLSRQAASNIRDDNRSFGSAIKALLILAVLAALGVGFVGAIASIVNLGFQGGQAGSSTLLTTILAAIGVFIGIFLSVAINALLLHLVASIFGGRISYGQAFAVFTGVGIALLIVSSPISYLLLLIPFGYFLFALIGIYQFFVVVLAVRGAYGFGIGRAIATVILPTILLIVLAVILGITLSDTQTLVLD
jgi:hypothetical protein